MNHDTILQREPAVRPDAPPLLQLLGTVFRERREVVWNGKRAALTPKCFKFLAKLAVTKATQPERWVTRDELERGENQARYLYRLKGELEAQCGSLPELWENNRRGAYRMTLAPEQIEVDWQVLEQYDDYDLVAWARAFRTGPVSRSDAARTERAQLSALP